MKAGGFFVLLFLLTCFLWGTVVVVGGIKRTLGAWFSPKPERVEPQGPVREAATPRPPQVVEVVALRNEPQATASQSAMRSVHALQQDANQEVAQTLHAEVQSALRHMRQAHGLLREGVLTEDEFAQIKAQLIRQMGSNRLGAAT